MKWCIFVEEEKSYALRCKNNEQPKWKEETNVKASYSSNIYVVRVWYRPRRCVKNANYYWSKRTSAACTRKRKRRQQLRWRWETLSSTFASIPLTSFVVSMKAEQQQTTIENHHCSWSLSCFRNCALPCP